MRFIIIIGLFLWTTILNAQSNKTILRKDYIGNWYNPKTNQWSYGFFEKFAIINGKVSFYQDIFKTKKGYKISFNDSTNLNPVNLTLIKNTLSINKAKFNKFDKFLPKYIGNDTTTFYDSKFSTIDTTIISGYLRNNNSNKPFEIQIRNWINGKIENYYADLDSNGFFTIKLPLNNTSQVYMDWKRSDINDIITPGEKYFIYKDLTSGETLFFGDNARLHNEISKYHEYISNNNYYLKFNETQLAYENSLKDNSFLNFKLSQLDSMRIIDSNYISQNNLSDRTKYYIINNTRFNIAFDIMQKQFQLDNSKKEKFSDAYMEKVKVLFFDNNIKPYSLITNNFKFLVDYSRYKGKEINGFNQRSISNNAVMFKAIDIGLIKLDKDMLGFLKFFKKDFKKELSLQDSMEFKNFISLHPDIFQRYQSLFQINNDIIDAYIDYELYVKQLADGYKQFLNQDLIDILHTKNILEIFEKQPKPLIQQTLTEFLEPIASLSLKNKIKAENDKLKMSLEGNEIQYNILKNTEHLKEAKDADIIIKNLLAEHKGKVIYMDFWGTWCVPCLQEMEHFNKVKSAFEGKEIVFLYLANRTSNEAWKNYITIKKLVGTNIFHYNLPAEQQSMVERRLGINGFPTYMIFDKDGKLVNNSAPRPSNLEELKREVEKYL